MENNSTEIMKTIKVQSEIRSGVHPRAQPFFYKGNNIGCLLIHGFTGSPPELLPLGEYLAGQGYTVYAPLLAGHGTAVEDLAKTTWTDWLESATAGLRRLQKEPVEFIYLIGLSMGGLLSLFIAAEESKERKRITNSFSMEPHIAGVVTLNTPIFLQNRKAKLSPVLQWVYPYTAKDFDVISKDEADALRFAYSEIPLRGVANLVRLIRQVQKRLAQVTIPALVVQSYADETVQPASGEYLIQNLGGPRQLLWLQKAPHLLTFSKEREKVFQVVGDFIKGAQK